MLVRLKGGPRALPAMFSGFHSWSLLYLLYVRSFVSSGDPKPECFLLHSGVHCNYIAFG